jgi:hypothetical protein
MSLSHITEYMGPALLSAVAETRLTVREKQGQTKSKFQPHAGTHHGIIAGRPDASGTGFAACNWYQGVQRRNNMRLFCAQRSGSNGGLSGESFGMAGSLMPVLRTLLSPPP